MELQQKRALVTGATRGIGLEIARQLGAAGCRVAIGGRSEASIARALSVLEREATVAAAGYACDVGSAADVEGLMDWCEEQLGGLDILINNAGVGIFKQVEELTPEEWRATVGTNLDALFYTCHRAVPLMKRGGGGFIVNIGSLAGKNAFPGGAAYNASKFGLIGFSEALMQEVRHDDIQIAYVMPGSVDTDFGHSPPGADWKLSASDVAEVVLETLQRHPRCLTSRIEMRPAKPPR